MSDFTSDFWSVYIGLITVVSIIACGVLLFTFSSATAGAPGETTGHVWDEDLGERNSPLPRWWMWLFFGCITFAFIYLALYPGLGSYAGAYGWSSHGQYDAEEQQAAATYGPIFEKYLKQDIQAVAADPEARAIGQRLFLTYCAQCHGSDAGGGRGFPNLRDGDWLYGGAPETIKASITNGRNGMMPPLGAAIGGEEAVRDVANYVLSLSGRPHDQARAARGKTTFDTVCAACHTPAGTGNPAIGSPNLTDGVWLWGGSEATIIETITNGRSNQMPAHKDKLGEGKIHLLAAYVYGLSAQAPK